MGWLRLVGSIKLLVSFAGYCLFYRALLQEFFVYSVTHVVYLRRKELFIANEFIAIDIDLLHPQIFFLKKILFE